MEQWPSFLRRHCCFALFCMFPHHFARRPNPNPQNKQWTTVWLAAICWSPGTVLLLEPPRRRKLVPQRMEKKATKNNKSALGSKKREWKIHFHVSCGYWWELRLNQTVSSLQCVKILTFCRFSMILRHDSNRCPELLTWLDELLIETPCFFSAQHTDSFHWWKFWCYE